MKTQKQNLRPRPSLLKAKAPILLTAEKVDEAMAQLKDGGLLAVSLETTSLVRGEGDARVLGLATEKNPRPVLFDLTRMVERTRKKLHSLFQSRQIKVAYDWAEVGGVLLANKLPVAGRLFDIRLAAQLLKAGVAKNPPEVPALAQALLGKDPGRLERTFSWSGPLVDAQLCLAQRRAAVLLPLREQLVDLLYEHGLEEVAKLEFDCLPALIEMGQCGIRVDVPRLQEVQRQLLERAAEYKEQLLPWLPQQVNLNSPKQIREAFAKLGIRVESVDRETLLTLKNHQEIVDCLLGYREVTTQEKTTVRKCLEVTDPKTSRLYPQWNQLGADTGRLSCSSPPLQGIPKTVEIRSCFIPEDGSVFVIGDLSQVELRVAAEISADFRMIKAFHEGQDLHRLTASLVTGKTLLEVTDEERQAAKALNFGLLFGMGDAGLQTYARTKYRVELTMREAQSFRRKFFQAYPGLASWIEEQAANQNRETRTLSGRRRRWSTDQVSATALINSPIQGTAADILKKALGSLPAALLPYSARIVACIHDEIIIEVDEGNAEEVAGILKETMEKAGDCYLREVPTVAEVRIARNWAKS